MNLGVFYVLMHPAAFFELRLHVSTGTGVRGGAAFHFAIRLPSIVIRFPSTKVVLALSCLLFPYLLLTANSLPFANRRFVPGGLA